MNDDQRKRLTLYLGECWHEEAEDGECYKCISYAGPFHSLPEQRTFTTYEDLGSLKEALERNGE